MSHIPFRSIRSRVAALATAVTLGIAAAGHAQTAELKMTTYVPIGSGTWNAYMQTFIDTARDITGGELRIKGFGVGVLASPFDAWKAVQKGTADLCFCWTGFAANTDPANTIFAGIAGGMSPEVFQHWLLAGDGGKLWRAFRHETGKLHPVITGFGPTEIFLHSHRKVQTIADLEGMKIRTAGAWADILKSLGAAPTVLAPSDIYVALERHVIDATEFITPATNYKLGFHKIAKYIIYPGIHQPTHANEVIWRLEDWEKLPRALRRKITLAGEIAGFKSHMKLGLEDLDAIEKMRKGRNEWVNLDPALSARVTELSRAWSFARAKEQSAKGNPWMQRVSESYWAFYDRFEKFGDYRVK